MSPCMLDLLQGIPFSVFVPCHGSFGLFSSNISSDYCHEQRMVDWAQCGIDCITARSAHTLSLVLFSVCGSRDQSTHSSPAQLIARQSG